MEGGWVGDEERERFVKVMFQLHIIHNGHGNARGYVLKVLR